MVDINIPGLITLRKQELAEAIRERDLANVRVIRLQNDIKALHGLYFRDVIVNKAKEQQDAVVGLSDAVRSVVRLNRVPMTAAQVKSSLDMMGFDFSGFSNPSAAVHNTLKRLVEMKELMFTPGIKTYHWHNLFYGTK